jgi:hypothetical protein
MNAKKYSMSITGISLCLISFLSICFGVVTHASTPVMIIMDFPATQFVSNSSEYNAKDTVKCEKLELVDMLSLEHFHDYLAKNDFVVCGEWKMEVSNRRRPRSIKRIKKDDLALLEARVKEGAPECCIVFVFCRDTSEFNIETHEFYMTGNEIFFVAIGTREQSPLYDPKL